MFLYVSVKVHLYVFLYVFNFFSKTILNAIYWEIILFPWTKKQKFSQPIATTLVALSILTLPLNIKLFGGIDVYLPGWVDVRMN